MNAITECPDRSDQPIVTPARAGWHAALALQYRRCAARTVLAARRHHGPLVVQRPFYPEGETVCHTILVHPPAGIVGGDYLNFSATLSEGAHVLLTTPGAGKWYRSAGGDTPPGRFRQRIELASGACCEWLPQESIVYDGAVGEQSLTVELAGDACFIGSEMLCLGRTGSGERFTHGALTLSTRISRDGRPLWLEAGRIEGGGALLDSPAGLAGQPVVATLLAASPKVDEALRDACRAFEPAAGEGGVTLLPGLLVARWLGPQAEAGQHWLRALWRVLRPTLAGRAAEDPRIWST
ncbi:urease accessory protein [Zoogloeaceae bacteirum Par-f-2]|jgi:urease accessory protein|uniref:urease accessory protein UreD n=1 Tax=Pseudothauera hydrothermalis TaxID=2184083 RepID=UPI000C79A93F|nr:urease accessory protein UreD [Pseudothauera hydrothermalis]AUM00234.1 urease accessory protein [Rhodocyclaceae bacterium]AVZ79414.1 urease accessory protein [Zoogloeaceae bacteirum Par-f-2]